MINICIYIYIYIYNYCETLRQNYIYRFRLPWMSKRFRKLFVSFIVIGQIFSPSPSQESHI